MKWFVVAFVAATLSVAAAQPPPASALVDARKAVKEVRYDDARRLLVEAVNEGGHTPAELREIYWLSAATAVVLGEQDLGEQYYRRLIAIEPDARITADVSPQFQEAFAAALAYMAAQPRLKVRAVRGGDTIEATVLADPLGMVAGFASIRGGAETQRIALADGRALLRIAAGNTIDQVVAIDDHGNHVVSIPWAEVAELPKPEGAAPAALPVVRRWTTWAVPAGVSLGVAVGFLIDGQRSKGRYHDIIADSGSFFLDDAEAAGKRWDRDMTIVSIGFIAGGVFAVTSAVMYVTHPRVTISPTVGANHVGIGISGSI